MMTLSTLKHIRIYSEDQNYMMYYNTETNLFHLLCVNALVWQTTECDIDTVRRWGVEDFEATLNHMIKEYDHFIKGFAERGFVVTISDYVSITNKANQ